MLTEAQRRELRDAENAVHDAEELLALNVWDYPRISLQIACATRLFINLYDAAKILTAIDRAAFDEAILNAGTASALGPGVADYFDLLRVCRNAACHVTSGRHAWRGGIATWNFIMNDERAMMNIRNEHHDDTAIGIGEYRFYLRRHGNLGAQAMGKMVAELQA